MWPRRSKIGRMFGMIDKPPTAKARKKIIPAHLAVTAMRASGYKSTAYALAELIDNSIQAKATEVEVICVEERTMVQKRQRARMTEIAVIDNRSEEHTSELQSLMRISYAVFCLKK